jgi:hypothetical protein
MLEESCVDVLAPSLAHHLGPSNPVVVVAEGWFFSPVGGNVHGSPLRRGVP